MTTHGKPVLVATDLSARTDRAVDRATQLTREWGVRLMVLHAIEPESRLDARPDLVNQAMREVLPDPEADVDILPALGPAPTVIVDAAKSADCGLIVTGVARFNHVGDYFIGTAVDHVVRHATVPVLVVKRRPHDAYRTILVATDYSSCSRLALITAAQLFPDAAIHLVHAYHVPYEAWLRSDEVREDVTREAQGELDAFVMDPAIPADVREGFPRNSSTVRPTLCFPARLTSLMRICWCSARMAAAGFLRRQSAGWRNRCCAVPMWTHW